MDYLYVFDNHWQKIAINNFIFSGNCRLLSKIATAFYYIAVLGSKCFLALQFFSLSLFSFTFAVSIDYDSPSRVYTFYKRLLVMSRLVSL